MIRDVTCARPLAPCITKDLRLHKCIERTPTYYSVSMAMASTSRQDSEPETLGLKPHQPGPSFSFPKQSFGKTKVVQRSFQASWFRSWTWIHYEEGTDTVLCFLCSKAIKQKINPENAEAAFVKFN